jgi:hypothetical protein
MGFKKQFNEIYKFLSKIANYLDNQVTQLNQSKIFAGIIIIILNVSSKYVNLKLSKTMESYLKHTFNRDILVFAISWMGTRDIYIAFLIMIVFIIFVDFIFNEESKYCCLPEHFTDYHVSLLEDFSKNNLTTEEIKKAEEVLEKAKKVNKNLEENNHSIHLINKISDGTQNGSMYNM